MTPDEFQQLVASDPYLSRAIGAAAGAGRKTTRFGGVTEAALVVLMFPLVQFVLREIGLPWLHELRRFSELQRQRVHDWIDDQHHHHGFDPDEAEAASDALLAELERATDRPARSAWERLAGLIGPKESDE